MSLANDYEFISQHDPAVNTEHPEFEHQWQLYLDGATKEPPLLGSAAPIRWKLKHVRGHLERAMLNHAHEKLGNVGMMIVAASLGIVGATNWRDEKGMQLDVRRTTDTLGVATCTQECINQIPVEVVVDIGVRVMSKDAGSPS